jgi:hypothetical protein
MSALIPDSGELLAVAVTLVVVALALIVAAVQAWWLNRRGR